MSVDFDALAVRLSEPLNSSPVTTTAAVAPEPPAATDASSKDRPYHAAAIYCEDIAKAFSMGGHTAKVFMLLNQQRMYPCNVPKCSPDYGWLVVTKWLREQYGVTDLQWKRGLDKLEAAGLAVTRRQSGRTIRVQLLTKQVPSKKNPGRK